MKNIATGFPTEDIGFLLESAVCNELAKRGYVLSVGKLPYNRKIDLVARKDTEELHYGKSG